MAHRLPRRYCTVKSGNFISTPCISRAFHSSPHLLKPRGKTRVIIDASKEELFPTRRGNVLYEKELALSDKIRSARIAKKRKLHEIATQKHAHLIFEILQEALNNGRLKKADVAWNYLEFAPKFIDDSKENNELDHYVQIDLVDVGFEIVGVTMPNHRQYVVIWWRYNNLCKLDGGIKLVDKVLDLYKGTLRAVISRKMALRMTPRLVFRMANEDSNDENAVYHKEKMEYLVENALIEEYQKYLGIEFKDSDNEMDKKYKNESYHDMLLNKIYGDWRYDEEGNLVKAFNINTEKRKINDKWIETFLSKTSANRKPTDTERDLMKRAKKEKATRKYKDKAEIINRILSTDPNYMAHSDTNKKQNDILISTKKQQANVIMNANIRLVDSLNQKTQSKSIDVVVDDKDLDLIGFIE